MWHQSGPKKDGCVYKIRLWNDDHRLYNMEMEFQAYTVAEVRKLVRDTVKSLTQFKLR